MKQYQRERLWHSIKYSYINLFLLFAIVFLIVKEDWVLINKYFKISEVRKEARQDELNSQHHYEDSQTKLDNIRTDRGIEGYIRSTYPIVRTGESVITLYNASTSNIGNIEVELSSLDKFKKWLNTIYTNAIMDYNN